MGSGKLPYCVILVIRWFLHLEMWLALNFDELQLLKGFGEKISCVWYGKHLFYQYVIILAICWSSWFLVIPKKKHSTLKPTEQDIANLS